jgi:ADP-heptose:LPS heptosyltransferase
MTRSDHNGRMASSQFGVAPEAEAKVVLLFPGALGDFLCFAGALAGARRAWPAALVVVARPDWLDLLDPRRYQGSSIDGRPVQQLFSRGPLDAARAVFGESQAIYSWTGYADADFRRRLQSLTQHQVRVFPFRAFRPGEHAIDYYARCLGVQAAAVDLHLDGAATAWADSLAAQLPTPRLVLHCGSGSQRKNWSGFAAVVRFWRRRGGSVLEIMGPAEEDRTALPGVDAVVRGALGRVAAILSRASLYLGNDSGISHLAASLGVPGIVLFGTTDSVTWAPRSERTQIVEATRACEECSPPRLCLHRLPVDEVLAAIEDRSRAMSYF